MKKAVGIDIGGTKIAAGIISDTGELLERVEIK
ncbi:ROK family protein, partial [Bacillus paranthracis]|nr:ROK family protein [Bacillus paranthracis]